MKLPNLTHADNVFEESPAGDIGGGSGSTVIDAPAPTGGSNLFADLDGAAPAPAAPPVAPPADPAPVTPPADQAPPAAPPAETAPVDPTSRAWVGADGKFVDGWQKMLPEEFQNDPTLALFDSPAAWAQSTIQTKAMVGKKFSVPAEDASAEDIQRFKESVNAPVDPEGYGELKPETIPDEIWSKDIEDGFREVAFRNHMSKAAVAEVMEYYASTVARDVEITEQMVQEASAEQVRELHKEFGADYVPRMRQAMAAIEESGLPGGTDHWAAGHADVIKAFGALADKYGRESPLISGGDTGLGTLEERIAEFQNPNSKVPVVRQYRRMDSSVTPEQQASAQKQYQALIAARDQYKK